VKQTEPNPQDVVLAIHELEKIPIVKAYKLLIKSIEKKEKK
jgi:hypothetical protein